MHPWNPIEALAAAAAAGVVVEVTDHTSGWSPEHQVILLSSTLTPVARRCMVARMLAHRALGHWGGGAAQVQEARSLACSWLFTACQLQAAVSFYGDDLDAIADELTITREKVAWVLNNTQPAVLLPYMPQQRKPSEDPIVSGGVGVVGRRRMHLVPDPDAAA